jgi:hypothetical protein
MNLTSKREGQAIFIACCNANWSVFSIAVMLAVSSLCRSQTPHESHHLGSYLVWGKKYIIFDLSMLSARFNRNYGTSL